MVSQATPSTFTPAIPRAPVPVTEDPHPDMVDRPVRMTGGMVQCPRCSDILVKGFEEPECLRCGYVDYGHLERSRSVRSENLVSSGSTYVLRYVGDSPGLQHTLTYVKAVRLGNRAVYAVTCPFCSVRMEQSYFSGKRRNVNEERFKCLQGHMVSLTPGRDRSLGWK